MYMHNPNPTLFCSKIEHEQFGVTHACTYKQCEIDRSCCSQCLNDGIHDHQMPNQDHIMNEAQLLAKVKTDKEKLKKDFLNNQDAIQLEHLLQSLIHELQKLKKLIKTLEQNIKGKLNNLTTKEEFMLAQFLIKISINGFNFTLINEDINDLLKINQQQLKQNVQSLQDPLDKIQQQLSKVLQQGVKDYQENRDDKYKDQQSRNYDIQQIQWNKRFNCEQAIISNNEQYLVYYHRNVLHILDIKLNKICQSIYQRNILCSLYYTFDSQYLFTGDSEGFIQGLLVQNSFKQFYKQKIHHNSIRQIKIIKTQIITRSDDGSIIKTDFINKQQIFKLVGGQGSILSFDYDDSKDIICAKDNYFVKIWDCKEQSLLIDSYQLDVRQIQFINNKQNILCLDYRNIFKYKIDYQNKELVELNKYQENNNIFRFQLLNDGQNLLLICQQYCKIFNMDDELISTIYHFLQCGSYQYEFAGYSLDNLNFIALIDFQGKLYLAKALN